MNPGMEPSMGVVELRLSADGSSTFYLPGLDEHYHSMHGALRESMHVFIHAGLKQVEKQSINILEVGFGTGLNALLTLANKPAGVIYYHTIEKYPLPLDIVSKVNYPGMVGDEKSAGWFLAMHQAEWDKEILIADNFYLTKIKCPLQSFSATVRYHLVYFDAFAPGKQPCMWGGEIFRKLYSLMHGGGILTTYCAKGVVRRAMEAAGFKVERLTGPPGKREMIRAIKPLVGS